jgi:hypothetical protein
MTLLAVVYGTLWVLRPPESMRGGRLPLTEEGAEVRAAEHLTSARRHEREGSYRLADRDLTAVLRLREPFPNRVGPSRAALRTERRQVALLADLLAESLQEVTRNAVGLREEWRILFQERYAGKAVAFDARVLPDAGGSMHVDYALEVAGAAAEIDVASLDLWAHLPIRQPTRVAFGARLGAITGGRGRWVVGFLPTSGVLFTSEEMLGGLSFAVDEDLRAVLRRQAEWAADLPETNETPALRD